MLKGNHILIGISGGIAAYKTVFLIRLLIKQGALVKVIVTKNALNFVTPLTLETLSGNKIYSDVFQNTEEYTTEHISLTDWGDIFIVAPATANIIGKLANGIADDALSTALLAFNKPIFIAPAMNCKMYNHFSVKKNIDYISNQGIHIIEPTEGDLACGYEGKGRMEEPEEILTILNNFLKKKTTLKGKTALVSAGGTREAIDAVRYIGNHSSGLMGFSVANELAERGAKVILVCAPTNLTTSHPNIKRINVVSANEMYRACKKEFSKADITVMAAAVADYTPENPQKNKIKKNISGKLNISLNPTIDILAELGKLKRKGQIIVGFALETDNEIENATYKLKNKNLDFIILNSLNDSGAGFGTPTNKITIIDNKNQILRYNIKTKSEVAFDIVDKIEKSIK
jgi:phosphopantothenoylcysteine decarboxylase / phosphopantothenate---cysteine ligase